MASAISAGPPLTASEDYCRIGLAIGVALLGGPAKQRPGRNQVDRPTPAVRKESPQVALGGGVTLIGGLTVPSPGLGKVGVPTGAGGERHAQVYCASGWPPFCGPPKPLPGLGSIEGDAVTVFITHSQLVLGIRSAGFGQAAQFVELVGLGGGRRQNKRQDSG